MTSKSLFLHHLRYNRGMATENDPPEKQPSPASAKPAIASCRKKKSEEATFLEDLKDHVDEFIHASMDEHKTCFKKTIQKMFGMSKVVAERSADLVYPPLLPHLLVVAERSLLIEARGDSKLQQACVLTLRKRFGIFFYLSSDTEALGPDPTSVKSMLVLCTARR
ncbi:Isoleucine--tRNA ligase [Actinidia chinensis var. chinensis]|uniref:Isoleucine--tRNA ligase n=1 Tax=Actinidia chinensis var. chinensis TaxID=1590841 RepID=A0A2R6P5Y0_ACTCC|nr:Isoleucine--tRNA ligase [Actinidia chinensis var. chinensis]